MAVSLRTVTVDYSLELNEIQDTSTTSPTTYSRPLQGSMLQAGRTRFLQTTTSSSSSILGYVRVITEAHPPRPAVAGAPPRPADAAHAWLEDDSELCRSRSTE
jgi:hypothetical protein